MDRELIEHYARGGEKLALAVRGLTREDLLAPPPADDPNVGKWTIQQVVMHLADCESVHADRIKRDSGEALLIEAETDRVYHDVQRPLLLREYDRSLRR